MLYFKEYSRFSDKPLKKRLHSFYFKFHFLTYIRSIETTVWTFDKIFVLRSPEHKVVVEIMSVYPMCSALRPKSEIFN